MPVQSLDTRLMEYDSPQEKALRLGQLGYYRLEAAKTAASIGAAQQRQQQVLQSNQAMAAALNPSATPDASTSSPAAMKMAALGSGPNPLINRTGQTVAGTPSLQQANGMPAGAAPDMSRAAVRRRYLAITEGRLAPDVIADQLQEFDGETTAQENDLKLQGDRRAARDQDIGDSAFAASGGDWDKWRDLAVKAGGSPALIKSIDDRKMGAMQHAAKLKGDELDLAIKGHDQERGSLLSFIATPDLKAKFDGWPDLKAGWVKSGYITPEEAAALPALYPGDKEAKRLADGMAAASQVFKEEMDRRTADRADAQLAEDKRRNKAQEAQSAKLKTPAELALAASGGDPEKALKRLNEYQKAGRPVTNIAPPAPLGKPMGNGGVPLTGDAFLRTLNPADAARVRAIADGRESPPSTSGGAAKVNGPLIAAVEQFDPTWSKERAKLRTSFTTGPDGRNIGALNTAVVHLDQLHEAAKAMNNGSWQPGNAIYNYFAQKYGAATVTNYASVMNALAGETASALKGNATDPEIAHVMETLQRNMGPEQMEGVALTQLHVLGAKMQTYNERFHAVAPDDPWTPILPSARAVFARYGFDPTKPAAQPAPGAGKNPFRH
jgi:hypothetical protein